jgi:hypothetical protein
MVSRHTVALKASTAPLPDAQAKGVRAAACGRRRLGRAKHLSPPVLKQLALLASSESP